MPSASLKGRNRVKPITASVNGDYNETFPGGLYDVVSLKLSGTYTASGAGVDALDGPFGFLGRPEIARGSDPIIAMHGTDLRHFASVLNGGHGEILPSVIAASGTFLAQVELPLWKLIPDAAIDARAEDVVVRGRFRGLTNLGTTVTAITAGKLRVGGDTTVLIDKDGKEHSDHFEPRWTQQTIDVSTSAQDLTTTKRIGNAIEVCTGLFLRVFDASAELGDPNTSRADGLVREVRVEVQRNGVTEEVGRWTWGELKMMMTSRFGINAATGQISTGVAYIQFEDPKAPGIQKNLVLLQGDAIIVHVDTTTAVEDEFTAITPAASDLVYCSFIDFVPRGPGVTRERAAQFRANGGQR